MNKTILAALTASFFLGVASLTSEAAAEQKVGNIIVANPWARATAVSARAGAAYMTLINKADAADRLVRASADISESVELHTHLMEGDIARMRPIDHVEIPAGATVELKPGGLHIMFMDLKAPFQEGSSFPLTLTFERTGELTVEVQVKEASAMTGDHGQDHGQGGHR